MLLTILSLARIFQQHKLQASSVATRKTAVSATMLSSSFFFVLAFFCLANVSNALDMSVGLSASGPDVSSVAGCSRNQEKTASRIVSAIAWANNKNSNRRHLRREEHLPHVSFATEDRTLRELSQTREEMLASVFGIQLVPYTVQDGMSATEIEYVEACQAVNADMKSQLWKGLKWKCYQQALLRYHFECYMPV